MRDRSRWWRSLGALTAGLAVLCIAGFAGVRHPEGDPLRWTTAQWVQWRDTEIERMLEPTLPHGPEKVVSRQEVIDKSVEPYQLLSDCLQSDPSFFLPSSERGREMANFVEFVTEQHLMSLKGSGGRASNVLGYSIRDREYPAYAGDNLHLPPLLASQAFLKDVSDPATYKAAVDRIEAHNADLAEGRKWIVLPFLSQFIKSVDRSTYGRILICIPNEPTADGGSIDRWVMFGAAVPDAKPDSIVKSVSMIAVRSPKPGDAAMNKAYLMDFLREKDPVTGTISVTPTAVLHDNPSNNCYDCHKTAVIPINPEREYEFGQGGTLVAQDRNEVREWMNRRIATYGRTEFAALDAASYGPSLGPVDRPRSDDFIRQASAMNLSEESIRNVRSAMNCARCHDTIGKINYPMAVRTSRDVLAFKSDHGLVQSYIEKGWMPPKNALSDQERKALWLCLSKEYFDLKTRSGLFVDWLKGR